MNKAVEESILGYWSRHALSPLSTVLVACSGGPDSVALLKAFLGVRDKLGLRVECAHVCHRLRPNAELEAERILLERLEGIFGVSMAILDLGSGTVEERIRETGESMETAARFLRYQALGSHADAIEASYIALGHTRDDQVETVLSRVFKGSGPTGLKGIPEKGGRLIRPLLDLAKADLVSFLERDSVPFAIDSTNACNDMERNSIRNSTLPGLRRAVPGIERSLLRLADRNLVIADFLEIEARGIRWESNDTRAETDSRELYVVHPAVRIEALYNGFDLVSSGIRLPWELVKSIAMEEPSQNRVFFDFAGVRAEFRFHRVIFRKLSPFLPFSVTVDGPGEFYYGTRECFSVYWTDDASDGIRESRIGFPFVIRSCGPGDRLAIKGGRKMLSDLFSEQKIDPDMRVRVPIIEWNGNIIAVLAGRFGGRDRFGETPETSEALAYGRKLAIRSKGMLHE